MYANAVAAAAESEEGFGESGEVWSSAQKEGAPERQLSEGAGC